jgi:drug/metabolite transporter (DMT)-like permease
MTPEIALALGAMCCFGLGDLIYKRAAAAGAAAHRFLMVQSCCVGVLMLAYGLVSRALVPSTASLWGAVAGLFAYTGYYNFARSLRAGNVSINAPVFRLSFTVTAALAVVLLGEPLTAAKVAGLALALAAVWLLLGGGPGALGTDAGLVRASLARVLGATAAVGIANLLYKVGLRGGATPATMLVVQAATVIALGTARAWRIDRGFPIRRVEARYAAATGVVLTGAFVLLMEALARGQASVLVPIVQMGFVVTALAGFVFLGERFTARKGAGLLVAVGALACLAVA